MVFALTLLHVALSLVAVAAGIAVLRSFTTGRAMPRWMDGFMIGMGLTLVTGFLFPFAGMTPAIAIGILCVAIFLPTAYATYRAPQSRLWHGISITGAMLLFYFNTLVLIVQSFQKVPVLNAIAPRGDELPIILCQIALVLAMLACGVMTIRHAPRLR